MTARSAFAGGVYGVLYAVHTFDKSLGRRPADERARASDQKCNAPRHDGGTADIGIAMQATWNGLAGTGREGWALR